MARNAVMLSVFHVVDSMDPAQGGPPTAVAGLASAQVGCREEVMVCHRPAVGAALNLSAHWADFPGIEKVRWIDARALTSLIDKVANGLASDSGWRPIIHIHGLWRPGLLQIARQASARGIPYLIAPLGMLAPWSLAQKRWKKLFALRLFWRRSLEAASSIHVLNADEARQVRALGIAAPIVEIPNGVFPDLLTFPIMPVPDVALGRRYIVFLGRLHPVKGLDVLARAFAQFAAIVSDVDLVVMGPDAGSRQSFERLLRDLGIASRVHLLGPVYGQRRFEILANAVALCQPSQQEGFSMSIVEALGLGVPVVISENCHFPDVTAAGAGTVVPLDPTAVAQALIALATNMERRARAGEAARKLIVDRFLWPEIAAQTITIYKNLRR